MQKWLTAQYGARIRPNGTTTKRNNIRTDDVFESVAKLLQAAQPLLMACNELFFLAKARCFSDSAFTSGLKPLFSQTVNIKFQDNCPRSNHSQGNLILTLMSRLTLFKPTLVARVKNITLMIQRMSPVQQDFTSASQHRAWTNLTAYNLSYRTQETRSI